MNLDFNDNCNLYTGKKIPWFLGSLMCVALFSIAKADESGLQTVLAGDLVARFDLDGSDASDSLTIRGIEFGIFGPIDHNFDGLVTLAAHPSREGPGLELHEAVISSSRLPVPLSIKIGKFFLGVGRLNQTHQHDRPFITTPDVHSVVFEDEEGASDTGAEVKWLAPWCLPTEFTLGVTNGWTFGHSHSQGKKPDQPLLYSRITTFADSSLLDFENASSGILVGISYLQRRPDQREEPEFNLYGLDVTMKIRSGKELIWLWQTEGWYRDLMPPMGEIETAIGGYSFLERHTWDRLFFGIRLEGLERVGQKDLLDRAETNRTVAIAPVLSWRNSEFQVIRLEYLLHRTITPDLTFDAQSIALQTTFILGAHPAHDF